MTALAYAIAFFWLLVGCSRPADERWGYFAFALTMASAHVRPPPVSDLAAVISLAAGITSTYALHLALRVRELRSRGVA